MTESRRELVAYIIDAAADEASAVVREGVRLARELHLWEGEQPSFFDATPDSGIRTIGAGLHFAEPLPEGDREGVERLLANLTAAAESLGVSFEVQLDGTPLGLIAPEGMQPWVAEELHRILGLGT